MPQPTHQAWISDLAQRFVNGEFLSVELGAYPGGSAGVNLEMLVVTMS
jgi:hypothetical protein